jgi:glyoxylase-like metal-dependent hydrolase (beta-lactamase superfamily II)
VLKKMAVGQLQANCYILGCSSTREGMVIDPGGDVPSIVKEITKAGLKIVKIMLTHGHFDHTDGAVELKKATKAPVFIHSADASSLSFTPDGYVDEDQVFNIGDYKISVIHTPGHSPGGVCLFAPGAVFTGDTLFAGSIGRTGFPGGDYNSLIQGVIKKIFPLGDNLRVYPGHGPASTIGQERKFNPFFR